MVEENNSGWSSFNYGEDSNRESIKSGRPETKQKLATIVTPPAPIPATVTLDGDSQYKIAKKKELLNKKLN